MGETSAKYIRGGRFIDDTDHANIAECRNANIAAFIVTACNAHDDLQNQIEAMTERLGEAEVENQRLRRELNKGGEV